MRGEQRRTHAVTWLTAALAAVALALPTGAPGCGAGGGTAGDTSMGGDETPVDATAEPGDDADGTAPDAPDVPSSDAPADTPDDLPDPLDDEGDPPADPPDDTVEEPPGPFVPMSLLDNVKLYVNIGDSMAAGYNATGRNGAGGRGYARLLVDNHAAYPAYAGRHISALFPGARFVDVSESGAKSADALANLRDALERRLPPSVDGDVLVTLTCGGNDFNDDISTMILRAATEAAAAALKTSYREIFRLLRQRYEDPAAGKRVVFLVTNVHDPTGGTGGVPPQFDEGFCGTLRDPRLIPVRAVAIANLGVFNDAIAQVTEELGGWLVDIHAAFLAHGMGAGAGRWIDDDCVHPTNEGHHQLRREEWLELTGEAF